MSAFFFELCNTWIFIITAYSLLTLFKWPFKKLCSKEEQNVRLRGAIMQIGVVNYVIGVAGGTQLLIRGAATFVLTFCDAENGLGNFLCNFLASEARVFFALHRAVWTLPSEFFMRERAEWKRCQISVGFLKTRRHTQIEDFIGFSEELADKIGAKIPWKLWVSDPVLAYKSLVAPFSPAQYRICGPNSNPQAREYVMALKSNDFSVFWIAFVVFVIILAWFLK
uniref:Flavin-containing monooxygenase n=1 Tax=Bursaphelenchus xylophilus TaxID=6326 RepID=A0A1I7SGH6_BURXY